LPAEVVYDSVMLATGSDRQATSMRKELDAMAIADGKSRGFNRQDFALQVFGQSSRESNCDCDRSDDPSLLQSIYLRNDVEMYKRLADKNGWVNQACQSLGVSGPGSNEMADANKRAMLSRGLAMQKQLLDRIAQFDDSNEARKAKFRGQLKSEHERVSRKFSQLGHEVPALAQLLKDPTSWASLDQESKSTEKNVAKQNGSLTIDDLIEEAYLRTLSRFPDADETQIARQYINESKSPADGLQSILWALVNTKEFIISH
jgi:NurA-like 5'-3' nuclease